MNEQSSDDDIQVEVIKRTHTSKPDWNKLTTAVNPILFKSFAGRPISFHCKIDDLMLKKNYENLIVDNGGIAIEDYIDMENTTALMVEDNSKVVLLERPSFKISYIVDCIEKNILLDISNYLHNQYSFKGGNFMNIIFWENDTFKNKTLAPYRGSSDSSEEDISKYSKHTRDLYSRSEKETILKFLLSRKQPTAFRGNTIWKKMERRGVCPKRTYQSMKNHFLKTILFELDKFEFLSEHDKKLLKKV